MAIRFDNLVFDATGEIVPPVPVVVSIPNPSRLDGKYVDMSGTTQPAPTVTTVTPVQKIDAQGNVTLVAATVAPTKNNTVVTAAPVIEKKTDDKKNVVIRKANSDKGHPAQD